MPPESLRPRASTAPALRPWSQVKLNDGAPAGSTYSKVQNCSLCSIFQNRAIPCCIRDSDHPQTPGMPFNPVRFRPSCQHHHAPRVAENPNSDLILGNRSPRFQKNPRALCDHTSDHSIQPQRGPSSDHTSAPRVCGRINCTHHHSKEKRHDTKHVQDLRTLPESLPSDTRRPTLLRTTLQKGRRAQTDRLRRSQGDRRAKFT